MIYLSPEQEKLLIIIKDKPTANYTEIADHNGWFPQGVSTRCLALINKGLIKRTGNKRSYKHEIVEGIEYVVTPGGLPPKSEPLPDVLLESMQAFRPNNRQERFIRMKYNKMSRSDIAKNLGITKLELNAALIYLKLGH